MGWLRKARKFRGISASELAIRVGVSLNYIQRIEGGSRTFEGDIRDRICDALGFDQDRIPFETSPLLERLDELSGTYGDDAFCSLEYVNVEGRLYFNGVTDLGEASLDPALSNPGSNPVRIRNARDFLKMQVALYEM